MKLLHTLNKRTLIFFLLFASSYAFPDKEKSQFKSAIEAFKAKNYDTSLRIWDELTYEFPQNSTYWFNRGNTLLAMKRFDAAITSYRTVIRLKSKLTPDAKYYIAQCYRKQGNKERYRQAILNLNEQKLPSPIAEQVEEELAHIKNPKRKTRRYLMVLGISQYRENQFTDAIRSFKQALKIEEDDEAYFMLGLSYLQTEQTESAEGAFDQIEMNSLREKGLRLLPQEEPGPERFLGFADLSIGRDDNINLENDLELKDVGYPYQGLLALEYKYLFLKRLTLSAGYQGFVEQVIAKPGNRTSSHQISAPITYEHEDWVSKLSPKLEFQEFLEEKYLNRIGLTLLANRAAETYLAGTELKYMYQVSRASEFNYLDGHIFYLRVFAIYSVFSFLDISVEGILGKNELSDTATAIVTYGEWGGIFGMSSDVYRGLTLSGSIGFSEKEYVYDEAADFYRFDQTYTLTLGIEYSLSDALSVHFESTYTENYSNYNQPSDDRRYKQLTHYLGISYSF